MHGRGPRSCFNIIVKKGGLRPIGGRKIDHDQRREAEGRGEEVPPTHETKQEGVHQRNGWTHRRHVRHRASKIVLTFTKKKAGFETFLVCFGIAWFGYIFTLSSLSKNQPIV